MTDCPCGSNKGYAECCGRFHNGAAIPDSAEALMRSRYSAFVLRLSAYLAETWHPSTRPADLDLSGDNTDWQRLEIIDCAGGRGSNSEGYVEFVARHRGGQLHERSRFLQENGRWFYVDGEILPPLPATRVGRNDPCPCGSGNKYKKCCG